MSTNIYRRNVSKERNELNPVETDDEEREYPKDEKRSPILDLEEPGSRIWRPYLELANKYHRDIVHNWRDDMDSLLIFAALFSASVTAFVIEIYKTLSQDTGEVTISVLLQISQQLANGATHLLQCDPPSKPIPVTFRSTYSSF
ncbi:hypothetical protein BD410DRAFT_885814 [Rickenella mellea]|uniref:DUF6535 domain-containing protein n=1 Tax=Rickenella mellea TaxID=50990 RepID=A0A4Y7PRP2_9AGAM|nr:hypothetical protein BD410DRAFT_885814 [Rickenella mellea]